MIVDLPGATWPPANFTIAGFSTIESRKLSSHDDAMLFKDKNYSLFTKGIKEATGATGTGAAATMTRIDHF